MSTRERGVCPECDKRRVLTDAGKCMECSGGAYTYPTQDESPAELRGRWVPNGRGTLDYVEQVAS